MRRTERLFALAEYLRSRRTGITATELASQFDVTVRTIYRDLDSLRFAAFPVHAERGRGGGFALDRNYSIPPVNFNAREAALLIVVGQWLTNLRLLPFTKTLNSAIDKVRAALPAQAQLETQCLRESLSYAGVPTRSATPEVRAVIEQAWFEGSPVRIQYQGVRGPTNRVVRIQQVVMERSKTLLNCFDLDKEAKRQFEMHRISNATIVSDP